MTHEFQVTQSKLALITIQRQPGVCQLLENFGQSPVMLLSVFPMDYDVISNGSGALTVLQHLSNNMLI